MRVLFAGSPRAAVPTLSALIQSQHTVVGVITQPPKPFGRKMTLQGTPVFDAAHAAQIPIATPTSAEGVAQAAADFAADIAIVVAYGRILSDKALSAVPGGWWNVHFSLLPEFRGAAPVNHTILSGHSVSGVTLFRIVAQLDAGPVVLRKAHAVSPYDTAGTLLSKLAAIAPELVLNFLSDPQKFPLQDQQGEPTWAPKFPAGFGELDLSRPLDEVDEHFRAVTPEPGAFVYRVDTGLAVKIVAAWADPDYHAVAPGHIIKEPIGILLGTGTMPLILKQVHPAGKKPMDAEDWYRGLPEGVSIAVPEA